MPRRYTTPLLLMAILPLLAVATAAPDEKPVPKAAEPAVPVPPKLERKSYTEKTSGVKVEVIDPDTDPPKTRKLDTGAKFEMVYVPGGEFMMGSPDNEPGRDPSEGPRHKVKVGGFWMGKVEVSWDEFDVFWFDETYLKADDTAAKKLPVDAVTRPTNTFVDATTA